MSKEVRERAGTVTQSQHSIIIGYRLLFIKKPRHCPFEANNGALQHAAGLTTDHLWPFYCSAHDNVVLWSISTGP
eukprot:25602-Eustigmatos_ZCMA.PRE.1